MTTYQDVLEFWFSEPANKLWFKSTAEFDAEISARYQPLWLQAKEKQLSDWKNTAEGCLALIIVLDQFPLNMFRGTAKSFSTEKEAIQVTHYAISKKLDKKLDPARLSFFTCL